MPGNERGKENAKRQETKQPGGLRQGASIVGVSTPRHMTQRDEILTEKVKEEEKVNKDAHGEATVGR